MATYNARCSSAEMIVNITAVYRAATVDETQRGKLWYPMAHNIVVEWADTFGRSIANVACIVAALSPQLEWTRNLIIADDILRGNAPSIGGTLQVNLRKACAIRDDRATDTAGYFKQGCKVRSFAANLAGNFEVVTVDTHAGQIAAGNPSANVRVDIWRKYEPVASAYVEAAKRLKLQPAELQAITWLTWKRLFPAERKRVIRRFDR
jgi:hypothetical protein